MQSSVKLFVGNIPWETSPNTVLQALCEAGPVLDFALKADATGRNPHRGFGHVVYPDAATAERAIQLLNGRLVGARPMKIAYPEPGGTYTPATVMTGAKSIPANQNPKMIQFLQSRQGPVGGMHMPPGGPSRMHPAGPHDDGPGYSRYGPPRRPGPYHHGYGGPAPHHEMEPPQNMPGGYMPPPDAGRHVPAAPSIPPATIPHHPMPVAEHPPVVAPTPVPAGPAANTVKNVVSSMSSSEISTLLDELHSYSIEHPEKTKALLMQYPMLAHAIVHMLAASGGVYGQSGAKPAAAGQAVASAPVDPRMQSAPASDANDEQKQLLQRIVNMTEEEVQALQGSEQDDVKSIRYALLTPIEELNRLSEAERNEILKMRNELTAVLHS